jgi:3-hydroxy-9,10-secoandrosta-1,3,5(10)-triene-9,17-dione monooxygenase reductase component
MAHLALNEHLRTNSLHPSETAADPRHFRHVLGNFCTGVVVITGCFAGQRRGFTVQSLVSLSLTPPLVGFSPARISGTWNEIQRSGRFCVNILAHDQRALSDVFSRPAADRFVDLDVGSCAAGLPVLKGSLAYISCVIQAQHETGDHLFVIGSVGELRVARPDAKPLLFFRGAFDNPS